MILKNTSAILILGLFVGVATNLGLIGAQSYLLSHADAVYTVYGGIAAGLLFSFFLDRLRLRTMKFAHFSLIGISVFTLALVLLMQDFISGFPKAIVWYLLAFFGFDLLRWVVSELTVRHLDPARAHSYFAYLNACFEGGTVIVVLLLKLRATVLDANQTLLLVIGCCLASIALIVLQFLPRKNFEIVYSEKEWQERPHEYKTLKRVMNYFILLTIAFAAIEVSEDYLVKIVVKSNLQSYDGIRAMTENYFSISCALIVVLSLLTGKAVQDHRVSPIRLLNIQAVLLGGFSILCLVTQNFYLFITFEVVRRVCEYCLYVPANQMIFSSFLPHLRAEFKAKHSLYYYALVPIAMALIFSLTNHLHIHTEVLVVLVLILVSAAAALVVLLRFKAAFTDTMYEFVHSAHKAAAVVAAHMLSYIRPRDYVQSMSDVLSTNPKKLLRKTIVLGLGYMHNEDSVEIIKDQFNSEKEEVQFAALDALGISRKFGATQFMLNILLDKAKTKTRRVRLNAMTLIGAIYGKKAIPLLLNGLEDPDPRIVANALEVLSYFKDEDLKPYFLKHMTSDIPRIKANALIGLAKYKDTRILYQQQVRHALRTGNPQMLPAMLYVIGRLQDKKFREALSLLYRDKELSRHPAIINVLAWAMVRINDKRGLDLTNEIMLLPAGASEHTAFIHFFSLYPQTTRYDIIKYFLSKHHTKNDAIYKVGERLKDSIYDFHEELEYLKVYRESYSAAQKAGPQENASAGG